MIGGKDYLGESVYVLVESGKIVAAFRSLSNLISENQLSSNSEIYRCNTFIPLGKSITEISTILEKRN